MNKKGKTGTNPNANPKYVGESCVRPLAKTPKTHGSPASKGHLSEDLGKK